VNSKEEKREEDSRISRKLDLEKREENDK